MYIFSNLKISHRVLLLALAALAGILVISAIFLGQREIEAGYRAAADRLTQQQAEVMRLRSNIRESLSWEQDFLLDKDMEAARRFDASVAEARFIQEALRGTASPETAGTFDALGVALDAYAQRFADLVKANEELGLDPSSGLEGAMRSAVHSIEERLQDVEDAEIRASMLMMRRHEKDFILRRDAKYMQSHAEEAGTFVGLIKQAFRPGAQRIRVTDDLDIYRSAFRFYAEASLRENAARAAVAEAFAAVQPLVDEVLVAFERQKASTLAENRRVASRNITIVIALIGCSIALILAGVWLIGRSITRPIIAITGAMRRLAEGETAIVIPGLGRGNEFGSMAAALEVFRQSAIANRRLEAEAEAARARTESERIRLQQEAEADAREKLRQATGGFAAALRRLAAGDLSFRLDEPFAADFEALRGDLNQTVQHLANVMARIAEASAAVDAGSREIGASAGDLARRTEQQAASLEETAAALNEITANVTSSAGRAEEARRAALEANGSAMRTGSLVGEAVDAMGRIEQSSTRIAGIIGVIDDIAFQTNLLALNAGVEAARAGEAGRGFAVVAHEVRELAGRSAAAAREIKQLIRESGGEVREGARFVRETGEALNEIVGRIGVINRQVEAIAVSSREQSVGLGEVNAAVNHMDQATQQNAAMVEENTAASAMLRDQAAHLHELLSQFRLGEGHVVKEIATSGNSREAA